MAFHGPYIVCSATVRLALRERLFDRIEVGAAGREEEQGCARRVDRLADLVTLVAGKIVHEDEIVGADLRDQRLVDIVGKGVSVDLAIENHRRDHACVAQTCDEGHRRPVPVRHAPPQPLTATNVPCAASTSRTPSSVRSLFAAIRVRIRQMNSS